MRVHDCPNCGGVTSENPCPGCGAPLSRYSRYNSRTDDRDDYPPLDYDEEDEEE